MAPTLHCVRHAQGYHNLTTANHNMPDPQLTPLGEDQCRALHKTFPHMSSVELIVASPIRRTLNTALIGFAPVIAEKGLKVIALPELQETSDLPCDTGSEPETLQSEYADKPVDLELVKPGWNNKRMRWAPTSTAIRKRAEDARIWLMNRPEKNIVVVTHGGFLHYFTEDWTGSDLYEGTGWANTEFRSYTFSPNEPEHAHIVETEASRQRRLSDRKSLDHEEQTQLVRTLTQEENARLASGDQSSPIRAKA